MKLPLFQVDAFTDKVFAGNPAAICPLEEWLSDELMQAIAAENNLSETAFFVGREGRYHLRWFTPACEVDLCGHATLATSFLILNRLEPELDAVTFETRSGALTVTRDGDGLAMDFPARPPVAGEPTPGLAVAIGGAPKEFLTSLEDDLVVYGSVAEVRDLKPDMGALARLDRRGTIVTAPGEDCDFVSRFFAPGHGIPEDPVTGSAHCVLVPYWAERLGKTDLVARQVSARGGLLTCRAMGERVRLAGRAVLYLEGEITV